jgi:cellulose synthase A
VTRVAYPLASLLLTVYCVLPAVCLLTGKSTFPGDVNYYDGVLLILLLFSVATSVVLELRWSCVPLRAWWSDEKL